MKSSINDDAAKSIEELIKVCIQKGVAPQFISKKKQIQTEKYYQICNNCSYIKQNKICQICNIKTATSHFTIFEMKKKIKSVIERNFIKIIENIESLHSLGYSFGSLIQQCHWKKEKNIKVTATINTDGVSIFKNNSTDAWPFYLVFNELPISDKFNLENIVIMALYVGKTKISNKVVQNDLMRHLGEIEEIEFEINNIKFQIKTIYGSFDKPASSLITNSTNFNGKNGCRFCLEERKTLNKKPAYLKVGKKGPIYPRLQGE